MKNKMIQILVLTLIIFYTVNSLKCGENEIEGCSKCGSGVNSTKCSLCEDKYFLVLDGEKCIRCDDDLLAMAGCEGNCQMIKSEKNVLCEENSCKEGYYEIYPGTCAKCSFLFDGCAKCTYTNYNENDEKIFDCLECQYKNYYISNIDNMCQRCYLDNCNTCLNSTFCKECRKGYALYPNGKCSGYISSCKKNIYSQEKEKGICLECDEDYTLYPNGSCIYNNICKKATFSEEKNMPICSECQEFYALYPNGTCSDYHSGCINNTYSEEDGKGICFECKEGYFMDIYTKKCQVCNWYQEKYNKNFNGCLKCHVENSALICDQSDERHYISTSGQSIYQCSNAISNCEECSYHSETDLKNNILKCDQWNYGKYLSLDEKTCYSFIYKENGCIITSGNETQNFCDNCSTGYFLQSNGTCSKCSDILGEGCAKCSISPFEFLLYCGGCSEGYTLGNDWKCKHCENDANLIGCSTCEPLGIKGFKCLTCKEDYILIDGRCQLRNNNEFSSCKELENIGSEDEIIYSCKECKISDNIFAIKDNNAKICVEPSLSLGLYKCSLSKKEIIGENNYTCIKCINGVLLEYDDDEKKEKCKACTEGYYKQEYTNSFSCYLCDYNCKKCHNNENNVVICDECKSGYINADGICKKCEGYCEECSLDDNSNVICSKYKDPFFMNNESKVDACFDYINYCSKCSYLNGELKCQKCLDDYFLNKDGICEHCYINKNIGPACISCTDNEELKVNSPCQKCNGKNYFLTKENTCIFCKSENYGGLFCDKCGYINANGKEIIGCIECSSSSFYIAIEGKCIRENYVSYCEEYGTYKNNYNETIYGCIKCEENYDLTELNECRKIVEINCDIGYQLINDSCEKIFPDSDEQIIEGCSLYGYKYNNYYCIECDYYYNENNGFCIKKISNPFLDKCRLFSYSRGFLECTDCSSAYDYLEIHLNSTLLCYNEYYGYCYEFENIGTNFNPIYSCVKCYYLDDTIISFENGVKKCYSNILKKRCKEGIINTNYYTDIYICTKCLPLYILSYSDYYEKNTCKYIYEDEKTNNISDYDLDPGTPTSNGQCNDGYFTRNGKVCIKCDDPIIGMPGCGGKCTFKLNREYQLQCEVDKCKDNYFEILPGKCELCNKTLTRCQTCSYIVNDIKPIFKPERRRTLICNKYDDGLFLFNGDCKSCWNIISGCKICHEENNLFKCDEVYEGYYLDEEGNSKKCQNNCLNCSMIKEAGINKVKCNEVYNNYYLDEEGNIKKCEANCEKCSMINEGGINKVICNEAYYGYYVDEEGKINKCEDNCQQYNLVKEGGINKIKCNSPSSGYFINNEGNVKKCSDEEEGISNCKYCSLYSNLECYSCLSGYRIIDNKCKSIEETTNVIGCSNYAYNRDDNTNYCISCSDEYLYIDNKKICILKTEETYYCKNANLVEVGNYNFYNCTSCLYDSYNYNLVKNIDGYFKCYNSRLINLNNCYLISNIGTFNEPIFICEECYYYYSYYDYYAILVDEYGNQKCDNNYFGLNCIKGKITNRYYYSSYDYSIRSSNIYNCTECKTKYALEYDEYNKNNKCTPLECGVPFCKKCFDDDVYNCEECLPGYSFNKLGFCYIKPKYTPTITFKDIFRFALNGKISGNALFSFSFALRGLTRDKITERHSFIISTMFKSTTRLRRLEENKAFETSCELYEELESNDDSEIKFVDYNCNFDSNEDIRADYKMDSIKEGDYEDEDNLKAFNLDELVKNIDDISKENSVFDQNDLNKYILFTVDNSSKQVETKNIDNFNFTIFGMTNKPMANNLIGVLTFSETDNRTANCEIDATNKDNATLICNANVKEIDFTNKKISIKEQELQGQYNNIYFDGLNDVEFIGVFGADGSGGGGGDIENNLESYEALIAGLVVGSVSIIVIVSISVYCYRKKKQIMETKMENKTEDIKMYKNKIIIENNGNTIEEQSSEKFPNK